MKFLLYVLLTLALVAITIAGAAEILGLAQLFLNGPRWVNVWQYGLLLSAGCLLLGFNPEDLRATAKDTIRLISFPLLLWSVLGIFPGLTAVWATSWGVFPKLVVSIAFVVIDIYIWYLIIRYLMVQVRPGQRAHRASTVESGYDL